MPLLVTGAPELRHSENSKVTNAETLSFIHAAIDYSAFGSTSTLSEELHNGSKIVINIMVVEKGGKVGADNDAWWTSPGDFKMNLQLEDWPWGDKGSNID
jgi:hypothetical protein